MALVGTSHMVGHIKDSDNVWVDTMLRWYSGEHVVKR